MKTLICYALVGAASLLSEPNLFADITGTGTLTISAPGLADNDADGPYMVVAQPATTGPNLGTFETFCLGSQVDYYSGDTYTYQISTSVQPFATEGSGGLQYVALGTAWLYSQFTAGNIGALNQFGNSINDQIQDAIWYLQGQSGGVDNSFVTNAIDELGLSVTNNANGTYGVYALDLSPGNAPGDVDNYAQPQLCLIPPQSQAGPPPPVPEPGTVFAGAMLLFPLAVSTVRILRKSKKDV